MLRRKTETPTHVDRATAGAAAGPVAGAGAGQAPLGPEAPVAGVGGAEHLDDEVGHGLHHPRDVGADRLPPARRPAGAAARAGTPQAQLADAVGGEAIRAGVGVVEVPRALVGGEKELFGHGRRPSLPRRAGGAATTPRCGPATPCVRSARGAQDPGLDGDPHERGALLDLGQVLDVEAPEELAQVRP